MKDYFYKNYRFIIYWLWGKLQKSALYPKTIFTALQNKENSELIKLVGIG